MEFHKLKKLAIVCGGTGGHFYPGLSIARTFTENGGKAKLFLSGMHVVNQVAKAEKLGLDAVALPVTRRPRHLPQYFPFFFALIKGFFKARQALLEFKPDALLAMGSFASIPSVEASRTLKIPLFLHDGNARVGRANLYFSKWAKHLALAYPPVNSEKIMCKYTWTGMPIRPELLDGGKKPEDAITSINHEFNAALKNHLPTILIFGGSQGAQTFNEVMPKALGGVHKSNLQVIHLTGAGNSAEVKKLYEKAEFYTLVLEQAEDMRSMYSAADLVICRCGGSTIAELAFFAKFAILVPFPYAADRHQDDNGQFYTDSDAAIMIQDKECSEEKIAEIITDFINNQENFQAKGRLGKAKARPEASEDILKLIDAKI